MATELSQFIRDTTVVDTHEHMRKERDWVEEGPGDVLEDLFTNYVPADLISAGARPEAVQRLVDGAAPDIEGRWSAVEDAWAAIRHTGYGQAVRLIARHVYGIDQITPATVRAAQPKLEALRQPGQRLVQKHRPVCTHPFSQAFKSTGIRVRPANRRRRLR